MNQNDQTMGQRYKAIVVSLTIPCVCLLLWFMFHQEIVSCIFYIRSFEFSLLGYVINISNSLLSLLHLPQISSWRLHKWQIIIATTPSVDITWKQVMDLSYDLGCYMQYPLGLLCFFMAYWAYKRSVVRFFTQTHSMKSLRKLECDLWPMIKPAMTVDLIKEDIHKGPWAMAQTPVRYCQQHNLLEENQLKKNNLVLNKGRCSRTLAMQLSRHFSGIEHMPIHYQALCVCFLAASEYKKEEISEPLLEQLAVSVSAGKPNYSGVSRLVEKYKDSKIVDFLAEHHAYNMTFMASLLQMSRKSGVFASSEFLWLKVVDRNLWYMLNSVGRYTPVTEIAGAFAHWAAEKKLARGIDVPMVEQAVLALDEALSHIDYIPKGGLQWDTSVV